jgi:hypothetical protein
MRQFYLIASGLPGAILIRRRLAAQCSQTANMLAGMWCILAAVHGIGAGAVPAQLPCRFALQSDLIFLPTAVYIPHQNAARFMRLRIAVGQPITIGTRLAFACRSRQRSENNAVCRLMIANGRNGLHDLFLR